MWSLESTIDIRVLFGKDAPWVTHRGRRGRRSEEGGDAAAERSSYHNDDQRKRRRVGMHAAYRKQNTYVTSQELLAPDRIAIGSLPIAIGSVIRSWLFS